jgi:hypothetical protein
MEVYNMSEETKVTTTETEVVEDKATENAAAKEETTQVEKTFTQKEVDDLIQKRIARETKKFEKKLAETNKPTEDQINLEDENKSLKEQLASLNNTILRYEAAKVASELNIKSERMDAFLKICDLSEVTLDDKGTYKDEIKDIIEAVAKEYPEFVKVEEKKEENKGFVKVGLPQTESDKTSDLRNQIYAGLGIK